MKSYNIPVADLITADKVQAQLHTKIIGHKIHAFRSVRSTNDVARKLASEGAPDGTVVIAEKQTAGRGRLGRRWESEFGKGLWFSVILRPDLSSANAGLFTFLAGISVADALFNRYKIKAGLKWPNDILIQRKKVCGILSEAEFDGNKINFIVLGIGINVKHSLQHFPTMLHEQAISISMIHKQPVNRAKLLAEIFSRLESNYFRSQNEGFKGILADWRLKCQHLGKSVKVVHSSTEIEGIFDALADDGSAIIKLYDGRRKRIIAGDIIHL